MRPCSLLRPPRATRPSSPTSRGVAARASSGNLRHDRLNCGGDRQANCAPWRVVSLLTPPVTVWLEYARSILIA